METILPSLEPIMKQSEKILLDLMMPKLLTLLEKMDRRLNEDAMERRREKQEREAFSSSGHNGSQEEKKVARSDSNGASLKLLFDRDNACSWESKKEQSFNRNTRWKTLSLVKIKKQKEELSALMEQKQRRTDEAEAKIRQEEEALTFDVISSQIGESYDESVSGKVYAERICSDPPARKEAIRFKRSGEMIETGSFQQQLWKPPEERNGSMLQREETPVFTGEDAESWRLRLEQYFERGKFTETEKWLKPRQENEVKSDGRYLIDLANNAPELANRVWELAVMIGLKVKIRAGEKRFEPRNLISFMIVTKMVEDLANTAAIPLEIEKTGGGGGLNRLTQCKHTGQL